MMMDSADIFSELDLDNILSPSTSLQSHHNATVSPMDVQNMNIPQQMVSVGNNIVYHHMQAPSPIYSNIRSPATNRVSPGLAPSPSSMKSPSSAPSPQYRYQQSPGRPPSNPGTGQQLQMQQIVSGGQVLHLMPNLQPKQTTAARTKQILPKPIQAKGPTPIAVRTPRPIKTVQATQNVQQGQYVLSPQILNQATSGAVMVNQVLQPLNNGGYIIQQQPSGRLQLVMQQPAAPAGPGPPRQNQQTYVLQQQGGMMNQQQQLVRVLGPHSLGGLQLQQVQTANGTAYIAVQGGQMIQGGQVLQGGQILQQVQQVVQNPVVTETKVEQSQSSPRGVKKIAKKPSDTKKSLDLSMLLREAGIGDDDMFGGDILDEEAPVIIDTPKQSPQIQVLPQPEAIRVPVSVGYISPHNQNQMKNASVHNSHLLEALQGSKVPRPGSQSTPKAIKTRPGAKVIVPKRDENATPNVTSPYPVPAETNNNPSVGEGKGAVNGRCSPTIANVPPPQVKTIQLSVQNQQLLRKLQARVMQLSSKTDRTPLETQNLQKLLEEQQKIIALGKPVSSQIATSAAAQTPDYPFERRTQWQQMSQDAGRTSFLADLLRQPASNGVSTSTPSPARPTQTATSSTPVPRPSLQAKQLVESTPHLPSQNSSTLPTLSHTNSPRIPLTVSAMEARKPLPAQVEKAPVPVRVKEETPAPVTRKRPLSKTTLFEHQMKVDQNGAVNPEYKVPFLNKSNACKRLLRYHVFYERAPNPEVEEKEEIQFENQSEYLVNKFQNMVNKYRGLLLKESMRECASSEHVMIQRRFVSDERAALERLRENARLGLDTRQELEPRHLVKHETYRTDPSSAVVKRESERGEYSRLQADFETEPRVKSEPYDSRTRQPIKDVRVLLEDCMNGYSSIKEERSEYNELEEIKNEIEIFKQSDIYRGNRRNDSLEEDIDAQVQSAIDGILNLQKELIGYDESDVERTLNEAVRGILS